MPLSVLSGTKTLPPLQAKSHTPVSGGDGAKVPAKSPAKVPTKANHKQTAGRFQVLNSFVDHSIGKLSRSELATWLILYRDTRNGFATASQAYIAKRAGLSVRGVQKAIVKLNASGLVVKIQQGGLNQGPSKYRVESLRTEVRKC